MDNAQRSPMMSDTYSSKHQDIADRCKLTCFQMSLAAAAALAVISDTALLRDPEMYIARTQRTKVQVVIN